MSVTKKDLEELAKAWDERFTNLQKEIGEQKSESDQQQPKTSSKAEGEGGNMGTIYRCKDGKCGYSTDDLGDFLVHDRSHTVKEIDDRIAKLSAPKEPKEDSWEEKAGKPERHKTAKEYLDCPNCGALIEKELLGRGWKKPEEKKPKKGLEI